MRITLILCLLFCCLQTQAQSGVDGNMPVNCVEIKQNLKFPLAWQNSDEKDFDAWRKKARQTLINCLLAQPDTVNFDYKIIASENRGKYTAHKIEFNLSRNSRVPAYLLVPKGNKRFPALLMLHDHGAKFSIGKEKCVKPFDTDSITINDAHQWANKNFEGIFSGDFFAEHGYVVLAVDALFWGERGEKNRTSKYENQQALAANLMQLGMSWCGVITFDDMRSADFLASLPFVDAKNIGAVGFSMGAHRAWVLSAATDKIKASASVCWMSTIDALVNAGDNSARGQSSFSMIIPGIQNYMDNPHIASIACPKAALFINGSRDKLFKTGYTQAFETMRSVWKSQNAENNFETLVYDTPHTFNAQMHKKTLMFMDKHLK